MELFFATQKYGFINYASENNNKVDSYFVISSQQYPPYLYSGANK